MYFNISLISRSTSASDLSVENQSPGPLFINPKSIGLHDARGGLVAQVVEFTKLDSATVSSNLKRIDYIRGDKNRKIDLVRIEKSGNTINFVPLREKNSGDFFKSSKSGQQVVHSKTYVSKSGVLPLSVSVKTFDQSLNERIRQKLGDGPSAKEFSKLILKMLSSNRCLNEDPKKIWKGSSMDGDEMAFELAKFQVKYQKTENSENNKLYNSINNVVSELLNDIDLGAYQYLNSDAKSIKSVLSLWKNLTESGGRASGTNLAQIYINKDITTLLDRGAPLLGNAEVFDSGKLNRKNIFTLFKVVEQLDKVSDPNALIEKLESRTGRFGTISERNNETVRALLRCKPEERKSLVDAALSKKLDTLGDFGKYISSELLNSDSAIMPSMSLNKSANNPGQNAVNLDQLQERYQSSNLSESEKTDLQVLLRIKGKQVQGSDDQKFIMLLDLNKFLSMVDSSPKLVRALIRKQSDDIRSSTAAKPLSITSPTYPGLLISSPVHYANLLARNFRTGIGYYGRQMIYASITDLLDSCKEHLTQGERQELESTVDLYNDGMIENLLSSYGSESDKISQISRLKEQLDRVSNSSNDKAFFDVSNERHATNLMISKKGDRVNLTLLDSDGGNGSAIQSLTRKEKVAIDLTVDITDTLKSIGSDSVSQKLVNTLDDNSMESLRKVIKDLGQRHMPQTFRRGQRGGDCSIEAHLGLLKNTLSHTAYLKVKSHLLKGAISTFNKADKSEIYQDIIYSYNEDMAFDYDDTWKNHYNSPLDIVSSDEDIDRDVKIDNFINNSIEVLEKRLKDNEDRIQHKAVDRYFSDDEKYNPVGPEPTSIALSEKGYSPVTIHEDGYCGYRCAVFLALDHVRTLYRQGALDYPNKLMALGKAFPESPDIIKLIYNQDPIVSDDGKLPESIDSVIRGYADTYIDKGQIENYLSRILGLDKIGKSFSPETGLVSVNSDGSKNIVSYQPITSTRKSSAPSGPLSTLEAAGLPKNLIRFTERPHGEWGSHYDIYTKNSASKVSWRDFNSFLY